MEEEGYWNLYNAKIRDATTYTLVQVQKLTINIGVSLTRVEYIYFDNSLFALLRLDKFMIFG